MAESLAYQVLGKIDQPAELYHRLMTVVAPIIYATDWMMI
jgi:hypothetical protein